MSVFQKIHSIFELLEQNYRKGLSALEIGEALGLTKSTCYRILKDLRKQNYVFIKKNSGRYFLSYTFLRFADFVLEGMDEATVCLPYLEDLHAMTEESTFFARLSGNICVDITVCGFTDTTVSIARGQELPLHCTAVGKACLAFLPEKTRNNLIENINFEPKSPTTITCPEKLKEELETVYKTGYALSLGELNSGVNAMATPVFTRNNTLIGAISVVGREANLPREELVRLKEEFIDASIDISATLGGKFPDWV